MAVIKTNQIYKMKVIEQEKLQYKIIYKKIQNNL
jgi:hypothetical protein